MITLLSSSLFASEEKCSKLEDQILMGDLVIESLIDGAKGIGDVQASAKTAENQAINNILLSQQKMLFFMKELDCGFTNIEVDLKVISHKYIMFSLTGKVD